MLNEKTKHFLRDPIFDQISQLIKDVPCWTPIDQLYTLYLMAINSSHKEGFL